MDEEPGIARLHALVGAGDIAAARALAASLLAEEPRHAEALNVLGFIACGAGAIAEAVTLLRQSLAIAPRAATWSNLGVALKAAGQLREAEAAHRQALALRPDLLGTWHNLVNVLVADGNLPAAEAVLLQAVQHHPTALDLHRQLARMAQISGRHAAAARSWRDVLASAPDDTEAALQLAWCLQAAGDFAAAEAILRGLSATHPGDPAVHETLGHVLRARGRLGEAEQAFNDSLAAAPGQAPVWLTLSDTLLRLGRSDAAEAAARQALAIDPRCAGAAANLGNALAAKGQHQEAEAACALALSLKPDCAEALNGRGLARLRQGAPVAAEADFRAVLRLRPDLAGAGANLALALLDQGLPAAALDALRTACARDPDSPAIRRILMFCLNYQPDLSAEAIYAEVQAWGASQTMPLAAPAIVDRRPDRRLNIGYVSPDFRAQSASFFIRPLLAAHDRQVVRVVCYGELMRSDATTRDLQTLADDWRETAALSDAALCRAIRADRIDVLVDMGGYTTNSRLAVFARRPAAVQVEYLLGHGATSGLPTMDAFLADARLAPPGSEHLFSERVVRLDRIPLAYAPPPGLPAVGPLSARQRGHLTFGYFGRPTRLHDGVTAAWARILAAVPGSRLMLNSMQFLDPGLCAQFADRFARAGIAPRRLDLVYTRPQPETWRAYGGIDIALDPFPHNAGTTTIEALWMGVPVVSLADRPPVGRLGASILHAVGLDDWVTADLDAYVARASHAAADLDSLAALRATLRARCEASPLNDAAGLARATEAAYRAMWHAAARDSG